MLNRVKIFASIIDDATKKQIEEFSSCDAYKDCEIRVMPDCHSGAGCVIGSVIRYKDRIVAETVGVDLFCGMLVTELGHANIDVKRLDEVVNHLVPSGFNVHDDPVADFDFSGFHAPIANKDYLLRSIGTLGGGNHFIELDEDGDGNQFLVIHSGSRNLGKQVCEYWQNRAYEKLTDDSDRRREIIDRLKAEGREREIGEELKKLRKPTVNKDLAYLSGEDMSRYLHDAELCGRYAELNRFKMAQIILRGLKAVALGSFTTTHNYVDTESGIIRKGAVSAKEGEKLIIPMNMRDGSLICMGKGNEDWLCSAPHGAGRIMSRAKAFETLRMEDFKESMRGVYSTSVCEGTLDEAPMVYKPIEVIKEDIKDTVDILSVIKPVYNFKAKDGGKRSKD